MTTLRVVGTPPACAGFALAGLPTVEVSSTREGVSTINALASRADIAVLLVEDAVLDAMPEPDRRELTRRPLPIIVPFPGPTWEEHARAPEEHVLELLQRAIGYRVRLR